MIKQNEGNTKTVFIRNNDMIFVNQIGTNNKDLFVLDPGFYAVEWNKNVGYYLRPMEMQAIPNKMYGEVQSRTDLILTKFQKRGRHTGVLLSGMRGTGKSLLARNVCVEAVEKHKMPVLMITTPFSGFDFNNFLEQIKQPCLVNVDEFEKVYSKREDKDPQEELLSMFEGGAHHNKLWLLTINETKKMNEYMKNRPGRIFYHFEYSSLPEETVVEVCKDKGFDKEQIDNLLSFAGLIKEFTFDVLTSIIEECQDFDIMPKVAVKRLNIILASASELKNPLVEIYVDEQLIMSKSYYEFDLEEEEITISPYELNSKLLFKKLLGYNPSFMDAYLSANVPEGEEFEFAPYSFQNYSLVLNGVEGKRGIREYAFEDLLKVGGYKESNGVALPNFKILVYPNKKKPVDELEMACAYSKV